MTGQERFAQSKSKSKTGEGSAEVNALAERARALAQADPVQSLHLADIAVERAEALGGARARAVALRARAVALRAQARWSEAVEAFAAGARAAEEANDALLAAQIPIAATEALAQLGRYDEALALAAHLESRLLALGADEDAAKVVANMGNIHFQHEAYAEALACWQRARAFFALGGQAVPVARLEMNIANVLTQLNRLPEAMGIYEAARGVLDAAGMSLLVAGIDGNLGFLQFHAGRYAEALQAYARARQAFERLQLPKDIAQCEREMADVFLELNLIPEARESYERVLPVFAELQMTTEAARAQMGLAAALTAQHRSTEALAALDRAEQAFRQEQNPIGVARVQLQRAEWARRSLAGWGSTNDHRPPTIEPLALRTPQWEGARREVMAALRTFRRYGLRVGAAQARLVLAELRLTAGECPIQTLRRLAKEVEGEECLPLLWRVEAVLGRACATAGRRRAAVIHYRRAMAAVERVRRLLPGEEFKIAFLTDKLQLYEEMLALLLDQRTPAAQAECFEVAERARSRAMLELLAARVGTREDAEDEALSQRLEGLRAQLNWDYSRIQPLGDDAVRLPQADATLPERVRRLEAEYHRAWQELQVSDADRSNPEGTSIPQVSDLQGMLDHEQLVEYVTVGDEVLAFLVGREEFHLVRGVAALSEVAQQMERLRFHWSKFWLGGGYVERHHECLMKGAQDVLHRLHELLWAPLQQMLPAPRLTVIPHGILHAVPFHALYDGASYTLDRWEFAYAPSAAVWRTCRRRREPEAGGSLIFGVSDTQIRHVREEVAGLQKIVPNATVYQDGAATFAAVPTHGVYRYLHFAAHAIFRQDNPLFSGLCLADGWLMASDLYHRRLDCCLATLSACHTGMNVLAPGDETMGLTRGFLYAGARAVMVSLWMAQDAATAELMQTCYTGLAQGQRRAAALRAAQQAVRARHPHPYHWAAFALIGAP